MMKIPNNIANTIKVTDWWTHTRRDENRNGKKCTNPSFTNTYHTRTSVTDDSHPSDTYRTKSNCKSELQNKGVIQLSVFVGLFWHISVLWLTNFLKLFLLPWKLITPRNSYDQFPQWYYVCADARHYVTRKTI